MPTEERPDIIWKLGVKSIDDGRFRVEVEESKREGTIVSIHDRRMKKGIRVTRAGVFIAGENPNVHSLYPLDQLHVLADDVMGAQAIAKNALNRVKLRLLPQTRKNLLLNNIKRVMDSNPHVIVARDLKRIGGHVIIANRGHLE